MWDGGALFTFAPGYRPTSIIRVHRPAYEKEFRRALFSKRCAVALRLSSSLRRLWCC